MKALAPAGKIKHPRAAALAVVRELLPVLEPVCDRLIVAGSLRRGRAEVGDIELLYIPRIIEVPDEEDFFGRKIRRNGVDHVLGQWLDEGTLLPRLNVNGRTAWGEKNKLALHAASGIPIDLFAATHENWWNLLVCRTGGAATTVAICEAAIERGWEWNPYGDGFSRPNPERAGWLLIYETKSERDVFEFVGLEYLEPRERE